MESPTTLAGPSQIHAATGQTFSLDLGGQRISLRLPIADGQVTLGQLVAPARAICDQMVDAIRHQAREHNHPVSCRKGCSACCRYLVPLSVPEALLLATEAATLAPPARTQGKLLASARKLLRAGPPPVQDPAAPQQAAHSLSQWYARANMTCPFLSNSCCQIYAQRPLACREHLAQSTPQACASHDGGRGSPVNCHMSVATALTDLAAELEGRPPEAVMLPLALPWWHENSRRNDARYSGEQAIARLVQLLQAQARRPAACPAA